MAWRPHPDLIDGELSNRVPGKVTGWMRFFRLGKQPLRVVFDLEGDFHEDIRGSDIVLKGDALADKNTSLERDGTYMEGFDPVQRGKVGDMTAGLPLGPWTEELARRLKMQLEIDWQESGITGTELGERRRAIANDLKTAALGWSFGPKSADNHISSRLYGASHLADVGETVARRGKEMKDSTVVPHVVSRGFRVDFRDVGNNLMDTLRCFP